MVPRIDINVQFETKFILESKVKIKELSSNENVCGIQQT